MTFEEMTSLFIESRKLGTTGARKEATAKTIEVYEGAIKKFTDFMAERGLVSFTQMKKTDINAFFSYLRDNKKWGLSTRSQVLRSLRTLFKWVDKDDECQNAYGEPIKGWSRWQTAFPAIPQAPRRTSVPALKELKQFRNAFNVESKWGYRDYVVFCLTLDTGMRITEVCNLRLDMYNSDTGLLVANGKTGPRTLPLTDKTNRLLKGWLKRRESCAKAKTSPFVFVSKATEQCNKDTFGQSFRKLRLKNGLTHLTPHSNRHAFITYYLKGGGKIARLRQLTGHADYRMLLQYEHLADVMGDEAKKELEAVSPLAAVDRTRTT